MKYSLVASTDVESVVLFAPDLLPANFDRLDGDAKFETLHELARAERVFWHSPGDGEFRLHLYLDEETPGGFDDELGASRFEVPAGRICFTGIEHMFRDDDAVMEGGGECVQIPPGTYVVRAVETGYGRKHIDRLLKQRLSRLDYALHRLETPLFTFALFGAIALVVTFIGALFWPINLWLVAACALPGILAFFWPKLPGAKRVEQERKRVEPDVAQYVASLNRIEEND